MAIQQEELISYSHTSVANTVEVVIVNISEKEKHQIHRRHNQFYYTKRSDRPFPL